MLARMPVCPHCGNDLDAPPVPVGSTGEFAVPSLAALAAAGGVTVHDRPASTGGHLCTWCGKAEATVKKLLAGKDGHFICDECVAFCYLVMRDEIPGFGE